MIFALEIPSSWFFTDWQMLLRTAVIGSISYVALVILLRVSGKRTLSKLNAFDMVVTIAFGSVMAAGFLNNTVSVLQVILSYAILIYFQYGFTFLSVRTKKFQHLVKSSPTLLYYQGEYLDKPLRKERVARAEIRAAVRQSGLGRMEDLQAVILETDGSLSIIPEMDAKKNEALIGLDNKDYILDNKYMKNAPLTIEEDKNA
ncbi:MAG: YetF domain-containing protein [Cyclobacteriaceae bacterium]